MCWYKRVHDVASCFIKATIIKALLQYAFLPKALLNSQHREIETEERLCCCWTFRYLAMLDILNHDAWAAVSQYLDPISVSSLASTCMGLNRDISSNSALWRGQAQKRWPALFAYSSVNTISNWHEAYRAAHKAACEVGTALIG